MRVELKIDAIAYGGDGVGRLGSGQVCFVRGALPGETVTVRITERKKRFLRAALEEVVVTSPERIVPECPFYGECPGCVFQHCSYRMELEWKQKQFERFVSASRAALLPPFGAPERFGWRNRLKLSCSGGRTGYRGWDNKTLVPVSGCLLAVPEINDRIKNIPAVDGELFLRCAADWCGKVDDETPELLTEILDGTGSFKVAKRGFFQTNPAVAASLVRRVTGIIAAAGAEHLLELYCGVGVFSLAAAEKIPDLHCDGIEFDSEAIKCAELNAAARHLSGRCRFKSGDALDMDRLFSGRHKADMILVDPPRGGLHPGVIRKILDSAAPHLCYISCAPDTLQRDLVLLSERYQAVEAGIFDMFPATAHFESVTWLKAVK